MALTIGSGLASFGENFARGREKQANLELQKEALTMKKQEFALSQQIREAQLEDIFLARSDKEEMDGIRKASQEALGGVSKFTDAKMGVSDQAVGGALGAFAQSQDDISTPKPLFESLSEMDFEGATPARTFTDITTKPVTIGDVPEKVLNALGNLSTTGARGGKVKNSKNQKILDGYLDGITDAISPIVTRKGDRNKEFETEDSKSTRTAIRAGLLKQLKAGEKPSVTGSVPDRPLGVELLPEEETLEEAQAKFDATIGKVGKPIEGQIPTEEIDVITESPKLRTAQQMREAVFETLNGVQGFSRLPIAEQNAFAEKMFKGQMDEMDEAKLDLMKAQTLNMEQKTYLAGLVGFKGDVGKLNESQLKLYGGVQKMLEAGDAIRGMIDPNLGGEYDPTTWMSGFEDLIEGIPFANFFTSKEKQNFRKESSKWVMGILRPESGAVINDKEMLKYVNTYMPMPGDKPEVMQAKLRLMKQAENSMSEILKVQGIGRQDVYAVIAEKTPMSDHRLLKSLNSVSAMNDAVIKGIITPSQAQDIALLKNIDYSGQADSGVAGISIVGMRQVGE